MRIALFGKIVCNRLATAPALLAVAKFLNQDARQGGRLIILIDFIIKAGL